MGICFLFWREDLSVKMSVSNRDGEGVATGIGDSAAIVAKTTENTLMLLGA